jgi:hypothetical protein
MTNKAKILAVKKLADLQVEGHDPKEVLEQSIFYSWQGLFPIRQEMRRIYNHGRGPISAKDAFNQTLKNFGITH